MKIWFQNRRSKFKRNGSKGNEEVNSSDAGQIKTNSRPGSATELPNDVWSRTEQSTSTGNRDSDTPNGIAVLSSSKPAIPAQSLSQWCLASAIKSPFLTERCNRM